MKKVKFLLLLAFIAASSISIQAQTDESDPYRREIGFGTNIVLYTIFDSNSAPLDFIYKWKSGEGYLRTGASVRFTKQNGLGSSNSYNQEVFNPTVYFGKEWRKKVAERWLVNYGSDLSLSYIYHLSERESWYTSIQEVETINFRLEEVKSYGAGIRPFLGIMFKINQQLFLGTEASFGVGFLKKSFDSESYELQNGEKIGETLILETVQRNATDFYVNTRPASNIFVYYRF